MYDAAQVAAQIDFGGLLPRREEEREDVIHELRSLLREAFVRLKRVLEPLMFFCSSQLRIGAGFEF